MISAQKTVLSKRKRIKPSVCIKNLALKKQSTPSSQHKRLTHRVCAWAGLLIDIQSARVKREIVRSNYASYEATTNALLTGYDALHPHELEVMDRLKKFSYSYDIADLTRALRSSAQLEADLKKLNLRLTQLRTLASAGTITLKQMERARPAHLPRFCPCHREPRRLAL